MGSMALPSMAKFNPKPERSTYLYKKRTAAERVNSRLDVSFGFENPTSKDLKRCGSEWVWLTALYWLWPWEGSKKIKGVYDNQKVSHWRCGHFFGLAHAAKLILRLYATGLIAPSDILIRFLLYHLR